MSKKVSEEVSEEINRLVDLFSLAAKYKKQYYETRPIMRLFNLMGIDRGFKSRATTFAMNKAKRELGIPVTA